jgi:hypothetical protein
MVLWDHTLKLDRNNLMVFCLVLGKTGTAMKQVKITKMTTIQTKSNKVLETRQIDSLQEIIRRMKASSQMRILDPIIYHKLTQISKN